MIFVKSEAKVARIFHTCTLSDSHKSKKTSHGQLGLHFGIKFDKDTFIFPPFKKATLHPGLLSSSTSFKQRCFILTSALHCWCPAFVAVGLNHWWITLHANTAGMKFIYHASGQHPVLCVERNSINSLLKTFIKMSDIFISVLVSCHANHVPMLFILPVTCMLNSWSTFKFHLVFKKSYNID